MLLGNSCIFLLTILDYVGWKIGGLPGNRNGKLDLIEVLNILSEFCIFVSYTVRIILPWLRVVGKGTVEYHRYNLVRVMKQLRKERNSLNRYHGRTAKRPKQ